MPAKLWRSTGPFDNTGWALATNTSRLRYLPELPLKAVFGEKKPAALATDDRPWPLKPDADAHLAESPTRVGYSPDRRSSFNRRIAVLTSAVFAA